MGREWLETILSRFGPATDRAQNITTLDFEKPLLELDKRIKEVGVMCSIAPIIQSAVGAAPLWLRGLPLRLHTCVAMCLQVRKVAEENGVDVSSQIAELEIRAQQVRHGTLLLLLLDLGIRRNHMLHIAQLKEAAWNDPIISKQ